MRTAICAVIQHADRVLLGRRSADRDYDPGAWDLFGGHVLAGETPAAALVRELDEEIGIVPTAARPALVISEPNPQTHGPGEFHVFLVSAWNGVPSLRNSEHEDIGWFTLAEAKTLALADPMIALVIEQVVGEG